MKKDFSVAVVGVGMVDWLSRRRLRRVGIEVQVYEQAARFVRIGAGIQMMPNSMKVLRGIGTEEQLRKTSFAPYSRLNRDGYTGEITRGLPMPESLYNAPYLCKDAANLARCCLDVVKDEDIEGASKRYEAHRKPRAGDRLHNRRARTPGCGRARRDTSWFYGYDAWNANLDQPAAHPQMQAA